MLAIAFSPRNNLCACVYVFGGNNHSINASNHRIRPIKPPPRHTTPLTPSTQGELFWHPPGVRFAPSTLTATRPSYQRIVLCWPAQSGHTSTRVSIGRLRQGLRFLFTAKTVFALDHPHQGGPRRYFACILGLSALPLPGQGR